MAESDLVLTVLHGESRQDDFSQSKNKDFVEESILLFLLHQPAN